MQHDTMQIEITKNEAAVILRSIGDVLVTNEEPTDFGGLGLILRSIADALATESDAHETAPS